MRIPEGRIGCRSEAPRLRLPYTSQHPNLRLQTAIGSIDRHTGCDSPETITPSDRFSRPETQEHVQDSKPFKRTKLVRQAINKHRGGPRRSRRRPTTLPLSTHVHLAASDAFGSSATPSNPTPPPPRKSRAMPPTNVPLSESRPLHPCHKSRQGPLPLPPTPEQSTLQPRAGSTRVTRPCRAVDTREGGGVKTHPLDPNASSERLDRRGHDRARAAAPTGSTVPSRPPRGTPKPRMQTPPAPPRHTANHPPTSGSTEPWAVGGVPSGGVFFPGGADNEPHPDKQTEPPQQHSASFESTKSASDDTLLDDVRLVKQPESTVAKGLK